MPRKRRREKLKARRLTWRDVGMRQRLDFWIGWHPGSETGDWGTWVDFLGDWAQVREEALEDWAERRARHREHCRAQAAKRAAELREAEAEGTAFWINHSRGLYEWAAENLAKEEAKKLPFAEVQYQRVLQGETLDDDDEDDDSEADGFTPIGVEGEACDE